MRAMLAATWDDDLHSDMLLSLPMYSSPKLDGIRALVTRGGGRSRSGKRFPNGVVDYWLEELGNNIPQGWCLDGELVMRPGNESDTWAKTQSCVMSYGGDTTGLKYYVFDGFKEGHEDTPWLLRTKTLGFDGSLNVEWLKHRRVRGPGKLNKRWNDAIRDGYEGLMVRRGDAPYKHGRSTGRQAYLLKCKRWDYDEAVVIGVEPLYHNTNEPVRGADGKLRRSSRKEGLEMRYEVGALLLDNGVRLGTGITAHQRRRWWELIDELSGKRVRYKYMPPVGESEVRHPVYVSGLEELE